jgi:hypothetical protein
VRAVVPVTDAEAQSVDLDSLHSLGRGRRHLETVWPSDAPEVTVQWSNDGLSY